jgi:DNA topoisomerase-1
VTHVPEEIQQYLTDDQFKLYRLIWRRFVASQMKPALIDVTTVDITAGQFGLRASGAVIKFAGFLSVYEDAKDEDEREAEADDENAVRKLPILEAGRVLDLRDLLPKQHFTQPPPRFTEATLVKTLEENGIGRPSTYAQTLSTIQDRGYTELEQRRFKPTELGFIVNDKLVQHFPKIVDVQFTAGFEEKLDDVEEGKQEWTNLLHEFYNPFSEDVTRAKTDMEKVAPVETEFDCPTCGKKMLLRRGRFGSFLSCSDYPECKTSMDVDAAGQPVSNAPQESGYACPKTGLPLVRKKGRFGEYFECVDAEGVKTTYKVGTNGEPVEKAPPPQIEGIDPNEKRTCEKCGKPMVVRASRRGAFWGCTGYPKCRNLVAIEGAKVILPEAEVTEHPCPNCGKMLAKRSGRFGPFLSCTGYPECKTIVKLDAQGEPLPPKEPKAEGEVKPKAAAKKTAAKAKTTTKATAKKPASTRKTTKKTVAA